MWLDGRDTLISDLNPLVMIAATQTVASRLREFMMGLSYLSKYWNLRLYYVKELLYLQAFK